MYNHISSTGCREKKVTLKHFHYLSLPTTIFIKIILIFNYCFFTTCCFHAWEIILNERMHYYETKYVPNVQQTIKCHFNATTVSRTHNPQDRASVSTWWVRSRCSKNRCRPDVQENVMLASGKCSWTGWRGGSFFA